MWKHRQDKAKTNLAHLEEVVYGRDLVLEFGGENRRKAAWYKEKEGEVGISGVRHFD